MIAVVLAAASLAAADPVILLGAPTPREGEPAVAAGGQLFVSPSGEPFRAAIGEPYPVAAWFARADADHDGAIVRDEFVADARPLFATLDKNGDGVIDGFEEAAYETAVAPEVGQAGATAGVSARRGRGEPTGAARYSLLDEPQPVRNADADVDSKITAAEWAAAAARRFARLDLDHDGRLTRAELRRTAAEKLAEREAEKRRKATPAPKAEGR